MALSTINVSVCVILQPQFGSEALTNIEYTEKRQSMISWTKIKKEVN